MRVSLITRRNDHKINHPLIKVLSPQELNLTEVLLKKSGRCSSVTGYSDQWHVLSHDIENRSVEPCKEGLLLSAFCNNDEDVLVIDNTSVDNIEVFTPDILKRCVFIAHNADHEATWGEATGFIPMRYVCTMVNSKRLLSGEEGHRFDLVSEINRRLGYKAIPVWMDKDIRSTFNKCEYFENEQILYNAADTIRLKPILSAQYAVAERRGQLFLLNSLCSRIIKPIAYTEVRGIRHNTEKWLAIAADRQSRAEVIWQELDVTIQSVGVDLTKINPELRKRKESQAKSWQRNQERKLKLEQQLRNLEERNKQQLKSYTTCKEQLAKLEATLEKPQQDTQEGISWTSNKQIIDLLRELGCPLPMAKDKKTHEMKPGIGKEARANWFVANENSSFVPLMTQIDKQKKLIHNVSSFGAKWVEKYVRDGRIYTRFDQAGTATGRWTSGSKGKVKKYPNMSQIPKPKEYRECFVADDGRVIFTGDYKNQEGVLIISLSGDMEMKKITEVADQHSFLGTRAWRAVYKHRYNRTGKPEWLTLAETYEMNQTTDEKKKERDKFKNSAGLFPVLYGCNANKVAATAQVTVQDGQEMINVIKSHAPLAEKFLDSKAREASCNGYVVHNTRTNSRRAFTKVMDSMKYGFPLPKSEKIDAEMQGRNTAIQGSGIRYAYERGYIMVDCWNTLFKQDIRFVLSNYDEGVWSFPTDKAERYSEVVVHFMKVAAKNYLIKEVDMDVEFHVCPTWTK